MVRVGFWKGAKRYIWIIGKNFVGEFYLGNCWFWQNNPLPFTKNTEDFSTIPIPDKFFPTAIYLPHTRPLLRFRFSLPETFPKPSISLHFLPQPSPSHSLPTH